MNPDGSYELKRVKSKFGSKLIWTFLIVVLLTSSFGLINVLAFYRDFSDCQRYDLQARAEGLEGYQVECQIPLQNRFFYLLENPKVVAGAHTEIAQARELLNQEITLESGKLEELKIKLDLLQVEYQIPDLSQLSGVQALSILETTNQNLNNLYSINKNKPKADLETIIDWLSQFNELDLNNYRSEVQNFNGLNLDQLTIDYSKILALRTNLANEIITQYTTRHPAAEVGVEQLLSFNFYTADEFQTTFSEAKGDYALSVKTVDSGSVTNNPEVDAYILAKARERGYQLTPQAEESFLLTAEGFQLQPQAKESWEKIKQAAAREGVDLGLVSGYRSPSTQKNMFWTRFVQYSIRQYGQEYSYQDILSGRADQALDELMQGTAPAGYSRHHTGYTIDVRDNSEPDFLAFKETQGYRWISANNYFNAKRFGFIPSYPEGGQKMGPNPEAWEYVWVGEI